MIINIAGTSGSGKSHAMRSFLDHARQGRNGDVTPVEQKDRIIGYNVRLRKVKPPIYVLGAYHQPSGGCDTFKGVTEVFDTARRKHQLGSHVCYEGLFVMNHTRGTELAEEIGDDLVVLLLDTPLSKCLASVNDRRADRGVGPIAQTHNIRDNHARAERYSNKMRGAGARVIRVSRDTVLSIMLTLLEHGRVA